MSQSEQYQQQIIAGINDLPADKLAEVAEYRGDFRTDSDVDILVEFSEPVGLEFVDLANEREALLQKTVDLVSCGGIKPRYWKTVEPEVVYV